MIAKIYFRDDEICQTASRRGKVSSAVLSPYHRMIHVIANLEREENVQSWENEPDVCQWRGIECVNDTISTISWSNFGIGGSVALQHLPLTTNRINLSFNKLIQVYGLDELPSEMNEFISAKNPLVGTLDLCCMPRTMTHYVISETQLNGSLDFTNLPPTLGFLSLRLNKFSGAIDLSKLPESLSTLWLQGNFLSGILDIRHVAKCSIDLRRNCFSETIPKSLPSWLKYHPQKNENL